jgi:tRNA threonylcarbamoyl adenosine modification protein (Sua5/YciO/YrdC/YwlC family)
MHALPWRPLAAPMHTCMHCTSHLPARWLRRCIHACIAAREAQAGALLQVPLAVCVGSVEQVEQCGVTENVPDGLLAALLPGPVTVVLARRAGAPLSPQLNPGLPGVAIRVPDHGFIQQVVSGLRAPIVLTSANRSGAPSTVAPAEFQDLWDALDGVFDAGRIASTGQGSTIVDLQRCDDGTYAILRDGSALEATERMLQRFHLSRQSC